MRKTMKRGEDRGSPARRPRSRGRLGCLGATTALLALGGSLAVDAVARASPVEITDMTLSVNRDRLDVHAAVVSHVAEARAAEAQWVLAPAGSRRPWAERAFESAVRRTRIAPNGSFRASWTAPVAAPAGRYEAVLFVRSEFDGRMIPVASTRAHTLVDAPAQAAAAPVRLRAPSGDASVETATVAVDPSPSGTQPMRIEARVAADSATETLLSWSLIDAGHDLRQWWSRPALVVGDSRPVPPGGGATEVAFLAAEPVLGGRFLVRLTLRSGGTVVDDVLAPGPTVVEHARGVGLHDGGVKRSVLLGDLSLRRLGVGPGVPEVEVQNVSGATQRAEVFWALATAGSVRPWENAVALSAPIAREVPAQSMARVSLPAPPEDADRGLVFSVWVHEVTADGRSVHSDGLQVPWGRLLMNPFDRS